MAGIVNTGSYPKALVMGVKAWWGMEEERYPAIHEQIFKTIKSDQSYEEYVESVGASFVPQKMEGQSIQYGSMNQGYTTRITNVAYALGLIFTHEEISDNRYPKLLQARTVGLKDSFRETKEIVHANIFNRAFNSSYKGGDGISLCSTAHVTSTNLTQQNQPTVSVGLAEKSLEDMMVLAMNAQDNKGFRMRIHPKQLIVTPSNAFNAHRITKSVKQSGNANNDVNANRDMGMLPGGVVVNPYITSPNVWFLHTNIAPEQGLITQEREALGSLREDNEFDTMNYKVFGYERYAPFWIDWRSVYGSNAA